MKKERIHIEELKNRNVHKVPEEYFDKLPLEIKERIDSKEKSFEFLPQVSKSLKWSFPAVAIILIGFFVFRNSGNDTNISAEELLAEVDTDDLVAYLETSSISTEEIIQYADFNDLDLDFEDSEADLFDGLEIQDEDLDFILKDFENDI